jgi:CDP-4-dehydro-6-deoxyglucose reductase
MPKWNTGIIDEIVDVAEGYRTISLKTEGSHEEAFRAGQFITMDLPIGEKRLERWRSYSIANLCESETIELCISRVPKGSASTYLFDQVERGSSITYKGPLGAFVLPSEMPSTLIMICTGTGVAPFRSMIQAIANRSVVNTEVHLVYGTRTAESILYEEEFIELEQCCNWFNYHVALSREPYKGYQGYVHNVYYRISTCEQGDTKYYLCGWQNMIDEAVDKLTNDMKVDKKNIYYELYG